MRTTIIPAQITTVEDKIAGSLNLTQILILMVPILQTSMLYVLVPPTLTLTSPKLIATLVSLIICVTLVIRIKDKIIAQWLGVLTRFHLRPRLYVFNKNDLTGRTLDIPKIKSPPHPLKKTVKSKIKQPLTQPSIADLIKLEELMSSGKVAVRYQLGGKHR